MINLCSGNGQRYTDKYGTCEYIPTTINDIKNMLVNPPSEPKEHAKWAIFSTLFSRVHEKQREEGQFYALWADIDDVENLTIDNIVQQAASFLPSFFAYTSSSATESHQKSRIIVPLASFINGKRFMRFQKILNDKLEKLDIPPDRATQRSGQLCYLPNKGEYYQYYIKDGSHLPPEAWASEEQFEISREQEEEKKRLERKEQSRLNALKYIDSGRTSPIDAFNDAHNLPYVLESYGYLRKGDRWLSPNSQSKNPGVSLFPDGKKWFSNHCSDSNIGVKIDTGCFGSAFDLFLYYEHNNDVKKACRAVAEMYNLNNDKYNFNDIFGEYIKPASSNNDPVQLDDMEHVVTIPLISATEFWAKPIPPIDFIVKPFLQRTGRTVLAGPPGCCKTMFAMNLAGLLAQEKPNVFLSHFETKPAKVLYIDLENGPVTLQHRFKAMFQEPPENLFIHGYASFNLINEHCQKELGNIIETVKPDVIFLDPLSSLIHSNMFTQEEVVPFKTFFDNVRAEYKCSLFFIHHWRKATRDIKDGQEMLAGSFTLNAWLENQISINNIKGLLTLKSQKSRNAMHFDPMSMSLDNETLQLKFLQLFDSKYGEDDIDRAFEDMGGNSVDKRTLLEWMKANNGPKTWKTLEGKINESEKYTISVNGKGKQATTNIIKKHVKSESFLEPAAELEWDE